MVNGKRRWRIRFSFVFIKEGTDGELLNEFYQERIRHALKWLEYDTCLTFVEVFDAEEETMGIIRYFDEYGCWSYVGRTPNNYVSISTGCYTRKVVHHETMHALGTGVNFKINYIRF